MAEIVRTPGILLLRHGDKADMPELLEGEASYTDDTYELIVNVGGENINMNGNRMETGTAMSGTSTTTDYYSYSACPLAREGDVYLNTSNGNVYKCTTAGSGAAAKWTYKGCIGSGGSITVDSALSSTSTNPVQNKVIKAALDSIGSGGSVTVDSALSSTSTNPVQNKVIKAALDGKASTGHTHSEYASVSAINDMATTSYVKSAISALPSGAGTVTDDIYQLLMAGLNEAAQWVYDEEVPWWYLSLSDISSSTGWYATIAPCDSNTETLCIGGDCLDLIDYSTGEEAVFNEGDSFLFGPRSATATRYIIKPSITWAEFIRGVSKYGF